jgi:hypothetical protein
MNVSAEIKLAVFHPYAEQENSISAQSLVGGKHVYSTLILRIIRLGTLPSNKKNPSSSLYIDHFDE